MAAMFWIWMQMLGTKAFAPVDHHPQLQRVKPLRSGDESLDLAIAIFAGVTSVGMGALAAQSLIEMRSKFASETTEKPEEKPEEKPSPEAFRAGALAATGDRQGAYGLLIDLNQTLGEVAERVGITPLLEATTRNDVETIDWCLAQRCDPDAAPTEKRTTVPKSSLNFDTPRLNYLFGSSVSCVRS